MRRQKLLKLALQHILLMGHLLLELTGSKGNQLPSCLFTPVAFEVKSNYFKQVALRISIFLSSEIKQPV